MADLHPPEPDTNGAAAAPPPRGGPRRRGSWSPGPRAALLQAAPPPQRSPRRHRRPPRRHRRPSPAPPPQALLLPHPHSRPPRRAHPDDSLDPAAAAHRRGPKPAQRRARTAWIPAPAGAEDGEEHYYDDADQSDSAAAAARARVSGSRDASGEESDGVADWGLPNGRLPMAMGYGGVKAWLDGLGLSRYAPVFEIHEVDDEVLPLLTLEDLKDMGIGAVGSRRKMYAAIQKLRRSDSVS